MTGKRRVGRQDLKAVRLLAVLLVTLALMLQMDGQMDAAYAGQQMPGSSPVLEEEMLYITRKLDAGPELAGAGKAVGQAEDTGAGTAVGQVAGTQTGLEVPSGSYWDRNGREYVLDHYVHGIFVDEQRGAIIALDVNMDEPILEYSINCMF